jgi:DMSO/TMAO reductase YedYZ molybdopterin-dependent catalytic subunit
VPRRLTNDLLLALVLALVLSGVFGWALPVPIAQPLYDLHRALGAAVLVVLLVWKQAVIRASLSRRLRRRTFDRSLIWGSIGALGLTAGVALGVAWTLNIITFDALWGYSPLNIHVFLGLGLLAFVGVHAWVRRKSNKASAPVLSRRATLRMAGLGVAALASWQVVPRVANLLNLPGARRETGSKFAAALSGNAYPAEIWLFDQVPTLDPDTWRLQLTGLAQHSLSLADLQGHEQHQVQAVLDCTGGWWTEQIWRGVPIAALLPANASEVAVVSTTGHRIVFNAADLGEAILATHVGDEPLSPAHGFPIRLAVPGRRGYHWVKWVARIDVS